MTIIISKDTVISSDAFSTEQVQIATGATLTIMPGVKVDMNGNTILVAGTLKIAGGTGNVANLLNATISTENTSGHIIAEDAKFYNVVVDDFFTNGTIQASTSIFLASSVNTLTSSEFTQFCLKTPL